MKIILVVSALIFAGMAQAQQYDNSPLNYQNSDINPNNSSLNYNNSPLNYNNNPINPNSSNATYDSQGNRTGYEVRSRDGVINRFDDNGNRTGYSRGR